MVAKMASWAILGVVFAAEVCWSLTSLRISIPYPIKVGDTVTMTCDYDLEGEQLYAIKWYWEEAEFFRFVPRESPPFKTFALRHIIVDVSSSDRNSVTLKDVQKVVSGTYSCEVSADAPTFHTEMKEGFMQVHELPVGNMSLSVIEPLKIEVGKVVKAKCQSPYSYPAPTMIWSINNEIVVSNGSDPYVETQVFRESLSEYSESKFQITINQSHFDHNNYMELRCTAVLENLWNSSVFKMLKDETPIFAPVLGSTSSQVDDGDQQGNFDKLMNGGDARTGNREKTVLRVILFAFVYRLLVTR